MEVSLIFYASTLQKMNQAYPEQIITGMTNRVTPIPARIRNLLLFIAILFVFCNCNPDDKYKKKAEDTFSGFREIIRNPDSIPEIAVLQNSMQQIDIPSDIDTSSIDLGELIDSIYFIRLETNADCLIGNIDKILFFNDKILIIEKLQRKSVLLFSETGRFIKKIGTEGRGPGEYTNISDVAVDNRNNKIVILDDFGGKLLFYDFDGNFINREKLYYYPTAFSILQDGSYLFYQARGLNIHIPSVTEYNLLFAHPDQSLTGKAISYSYRDKYRAFSMSSLHSFNVSEKGVVFCPDFANEIYIVKEENKVSHKYSLNIGPKDVLGAMGQTTTNKIFTDLVNTGNYFYFDGPAFESDTFLYFFISLGGDCYFSKKSRKLFYGNSYRYDRDRVDLLYCSNPITVRNNFFVSIISPNRILNRPEDMQTNEVLKNVVNNLQDGDNPILCFFSLKNL